MLDKLRRLPTPLFYLFAGTTITRLGAFVFPYLTIYLTQARGFGVDRVGQILSAGGVGLLAGNFTGGWLTDKWSRRWTLVVALLLNAAGFAGLAFHYQSPLWYVLFLFVGYFGSGMYTPAANTVVADLAPESLRPFAYTVNYVCINLGMGLGPLMAGFLAERSYALIFIGDVVTSMACAALILAGVRETRHVKAPSTAPFRWSAAVTVWWRHPVVLVFCLANFFLIGPLMGLEYSVPLLVKTVFDAKLMYVGIIYSINAGCILTLSFLIERLVRHRNEMPMMALAGCFWAAGLAVLIIGFSVPALMICTAIWTVGEIIASILVPSFIARHVSPQVKGRFMSLVDIVRSFAGVVCPIGLGLVWASHGPRAVVYVIAALPALGVAWYSAMWLLKAQPRAVEKSAATGSAENSVSELAPQQ